MDLTGQLSNPSYELLDLLSITSPQVTATSNVSAPPRTRQRQVRLSGQQREELVARHRAGALQRELAVTYGVHIETVRAIIRRSEQSR